MARPLQYSPSMRITALITTLLLGSSSVALAAPTTRDHRRAPRADVVHDVLAVMLADNVKVSGRTVIKVPAMKRQFKRLELRSEQGRTAVDRVIVHFGNGTSQTVERNAFLAGDDSRGLVIDLRGNTRTITKLVVVGASGRRGAIDILAI